MLRKRYVEDEKLLPKDYNESLLFFRSTFYQRTTMSAQSIALGLYPEGLGKLNSAQLKDEAIWVPPVNLTIPAYVKTELNNSALPKDLPPIPIMNVAALTDHMLAFDSCPRYLQLRDSYYNTQKFRDTYAKYNASLQAVCAILSANCINVKGYETFLYSDYIVSSEFDGQFTELEQHKTLALDMEKFYTDLMVGELTADESMKAIAMHNVSVTLPAYFERAMRSPDTSPKMAVFETHDSTILAYLVAMGVPRAGLYDVIPYASNIMFELRKKAGGRDDDPDAHYLDIMFNGVWIFKNMALPKFVAFVQGIGRLNTTMEETCKKVAEPVISGEVQREENGMVGVMRRITVALAVAATVFLLAAVVWAGRKSADKRQSLLSKRETTMAV